MQPAETEAEAGVGVPGPALLAITHQRDLALFTYANESNDSTNPCLLPVSNYETSGKRRANVTDRSERERLKVMAEGRRELERGSRKRQ